MSPQLEHNYIGISELPTVESSDKLSSSSSSSATTPGELNGGRAPLNLKATELRLGPPGSESPGRIDGAGLTLGVPKSLASGVKRGFSDAIDGSGKWVFPGGTGSDVEQGKGGALFSPRSGEGTGAGQRLTDVGGAGQERIAQNPSTGSERVGIAPPAKAQVVGWPPIRSYRKNTMAANPSKNKEEAEGKQGAGCIYVKVSMDGAPYLRKVDLKTCSNYKELSLALEKMFSCFTIGQCGTHGIPGRDVLSETRMTDLLHESEYVLAYEDKDGDWMLVGDVPWDMFTDSCRRLRIMKGSDAIGIAPRAMEKRKNRN